MCTDDRQIIADKATFNQAMETVKISLGDSYFEIVELLSHGIKERKVAKILNMPYREFKAKLIQIKLVLAKIYKDPQN